MTNEQKQLLLKVLCAMSPYGVKGLHRGQVHSITIMDASELYPSLQVDGYDAWFPIETFKPYLRPMSSMTEEEKEYIRNRWCYEDWGTVCEFLNHYQIDACDSYDFVDWLNKYHFDYRGLIPMGLALEAKEGMYKIE